MAFRCNFSFHCTRNSFPFGVHHNPKGLTIHSQVESAFPLEFTSNQNGKTSSERRKLSKAAPSFEANQQPPATEKKQFSHFPSAWNPFPSFYFFFSTNRPRISSCFSSLSITFSRADLYPARSLSSKRRRRTPTGKNSRKIPHRDYNLRTKCHKFTHDAHLATQKKVTHLSLSKGMKDRPAGKNLSSKEIASTLTGVRTQTERGIVPAGATVRGFAKSRTARKDIGRSEGFGKSRGNIWASDERGMRKRFLWVWERERLVAYRGLSVLKCDWLRHEVSLNTFLEGGSVAKLKVL